jgi:hypothetical protein
MTALSQDVFDTWKEADDQFKEEIRAYLIAQTAVNKDIHGRVVALETERKNDVIKLGIWSSFISAVFGFLVALWRH